MKIARLITRAYELAEELKRLADRAAIRSALAQPEAVQRALREAVSALYFGEKHKYESALRRIVTALSPELSKLIAERDIAAAYAALHKE